MSREEKKHGRSRNRHTQNFNVPNSRHGSRQRNEPHKSRSRDADLDRHRSREHKDRMNRRNFTRSREDKRHETPTRRRRQDDYEPEELGEEMITDDPVSKRTYFCGLLPREDVEMILEKEGEFVVRKIARQPNSNKYNNLCVSVRWKQSVHHIVMRMSQRGLCTLENEEFETVDQLVEHYYRNRQVLTENSGAKLLMPLRNNGWLLRDRQLEPTDLLGVGNFGEVWKAKFVKKKHGQPSGVAVKFLKESGVPEGERKAFFSECRKLRQLRHRHLVCFVGMIVDTEPIKLVMELCDESLLSKLKGSPLSWPEKNRVCLHIARAMEYLVACQVIHRDLAARNCLIKDNVIKLADLGMAKCGKTYEMLDLTKPIPVKWTCPHTIKTKIYAEHSDVWSFGVFTWEVISDGGQPYLDIQKQWGSEFSTKLIIFLRDGNRLKAPDTTPPELNNLMHHCMRWATDQRPTFKEIRRKLEIIYEELGGEISTTDMEESINTCKEMDET